MLDNVYILVNILSKFFISKFIGYPKEKFSLIKFDKHTNLKEKFANRFLGTEVLFVIRSDDKEIYGKTEGT